VTRGLWDQALGNTRAAMAATTAMALGWAEARGDGISIAGVIATWGGRCPLRIRAAVTEAAAGEAEDGGGKNDRGAADKDIADMAARGGGGQHYMWRKEQIKQFVYLIRSGEGKRRSMMNNYEFEDARDPTMAVAAADGNEDNGKNGSNNDDNRWTSSAWSNFIVRVLFLTLLLLAYSKLC
jgi:hypothetical protein